MRGWDYCVEDSEKSGDEWMTPVAQIHDDLTFFIPKECVDNAMERITHAMLLPKMKAHYCNVPLGVEISTGPNWCDMEEVHAVTTSEHFKGQLE